MGAINDINMLVKHSGSGLPQARVGSYKSAQNLIPIDRSNYAQVYDFYRDIAPAIRMRELKVDSLPKEESEAFASLASIPVYMARLPKGTYGRHMRSNDGTGSVRIELSDDKSVSGFASRKLLAHELRHALARKMKPAAGSSGFLNSIFGFLNKGVDIKPQTKGYHQRLAEEEMFTTNKENQYKIYEMLRSKLKRPPTAEEYFNHIDSMPRYELYNNRKEGRNSYQEIADRILGALGISRGLERYREALKSISMSSGHGRLAIGNQGKASIA